MLDGLLDDINDAIRSHNLEVDSEVDAMRLSEDDAKKLRWTTPVTRETVYAAQHWRDWPAALLNILDSTAIRKDDACSIDTTANPTEIIRMAKRCKHPTEITRDLCIGASGAKGAKGIDFGGDVGVKLIQLAHLAARSDEHDATKDMCTPCVTK